jgi:hypothetical protein
MLDSENSGARSNFLKENLIGRAMFDVKPVDESGSLDVAKINAVQPTVNLTSFRHKKEIKNRPVSSPIQKSTSTISPPAQILPPSIGLPSQQDIKEQFQQLMNNEIDMGLELAKAGVQPLGQSPGKPRYRIIRNTSRAGNEYASMIAAIQSSAKTITREEHIQPVSVVEPTLSSLPRRLSPSAEIDVRSLFASPQINLISSSRKKISKKPAGFEKLSHVKVSRIQALIIVSVLIALVVIVRYGLHVKHQIIQQSTAAVTSLQTAHNDLKALDFKNASQDFFSAYADFAKAGNTLNIFGAGITDILSVLPGGGTLKSAKNLVTVGQLLSAAGTSMTTALNAVSKTGALNDPTNPKVPIGPIVSALKNALLAVKGQVAQANTLMADIDSNIIPADKQAGFNDLKAKFPEFAAGVAMSADYAKFFETLINNGNAKYLVMFQNASELRPTGGFPGTYGVVSLTAGKMDSLFIDDVYNIDGQLKQNIIPPLQLQHITPNWGMRDSAWYVDFPASARNIQAFYKKESGQSVDGVVMINPEMVAKIMAIVGPIEMPQYHLTLTADNILTAIQNQVEYGANRAQPKQILKDFAPLLMAKIYSAGSDKWFQIFNTVVLSMNQRDVLMAFNNLSLESFVTDKGFGGQVQQAVGEDYLMPVITNIKGSKTDAVTDTSFSVATTFDSADAIHTLTITRHHNGGGAKFGFYNKQNPAYVRVLVPAGAQFVSITGNDRPDFKPLINYAGLNFVKDDNLVAFEKSGSTDSATGVITYKESGKSEFGFWLITDPGQTKIVTLQYRVPKALTDKTYQLYIQKQPALKIKNFNFSIQKPDGLTPIASYPLLTQKDSTYTYSGALDNDLTVKVNFK